MATEQRPHEHSLYKAIADWPYTPAYLQATLDPELIPQHGLAILRRSLIDRRTICFVGSGVSMAYGRAGWGALVRAVANIDDLRARANEAGDQHAERFVNYLEALKLNRGAGDDPLQSTRYPVAFQFREQLDRLLNSSGKLEDASKPGARELVGMLLRDDRGHAALLIESLLRDRHEFKGIGAQPAKLQDFGEMARRHAGMYLSDDTGGRDTHRGTGSVPFWPPRKLDLTRQRLDDCLQHRVIEGSTETSRSWFDESARKLIQSLLDVLPEDESNSPPLHRFVLPALWRLCLDPHPFDGTAEVLTKGGSYARQQLAPERDPLLLLAQKLGINRFLTTNYDLEIERMLHERGFDRIHGSAAQQHGGGDHVRAQQRHTVRSNAIGARARDSLFSVEHAAELIDFATQPGRYAYQVLHLHGRALPGDEMVVTEDDYLKQYLSHGEEADIVSDAVSLAFGANPVLFVGSGMSEDDILRPLRQFVAERKSREDHAAVVLLPATSSKARELEEVISLYGRFGVYAVHYGFVWVEGQQGKPRRLRWLAWCLELVQHLSDMLERIKEHQSAPDSTKLGADARRSAHTFRKSIAFDGAEDATAMAKLVVSDGGQPPRIKLPRHAEEESSSAMEAGQARPALNVEVEEAVLNATLTFVIDYVRAQCGEDLAMEWLGVAATNCAAPPPPADPQTPEPLRLIRTHAALMSGLRDALIGLSLCAKLGALHDDWQRWQQRRQRLPMPRPAAESHPGVVCSFTDSEGQVTVPPASKQNERFIVVARHALALAESPAAATTGAIPDLPVPQGDRFFSFAPSQTIRSLYYSFFSVLGRPSTLPASPAAGRVPLPQSGLCTPWDKAGRRLFVLLAPRGVGKGHFFEALRTSRRLAEFSCLSWPRTASLDQHRYAGFAFFNLSFSLEVISVFDQLAEFLEQRAKDVFPLTGPIRGAEISVAAAAILEAQNKVRSNRVGRLHALLSGYAHHATEAQTRLLVAFNGFNVLFDERGAPKNAEIFRLIDALLSTSSDAAPIDLLLVCSETGFPAMFTTRRRPAALRNAHLDGWSGRNAISLEHLAPDDLTERQRRRLQMYEQQLCVNITPSVLPPCSFDARRPLAFFHVLREARVSNTVAKYFPELALSIALHRGRINTVGNVPVASLVPRVAMSSWDILGDVRTEILEHSHSLRDAEPMIRRIAAILAALSQTVATKYETHLVPRLEISDIKSAFDTAERAVKEPNVKPEAATDLHKMAHEVDEDFASIYRMLGRNRFLLTLVCAAASERARGGPTVDGLETLEVKTVVDWFVELSVHLSNGHVQGTDDRVIARVLDAYQSQHDNCNATRKLPRIYGQERMGELAELDRLQGPDGWSLQLELLWHLALVEQPVEADVLALAPGVGDQCNKLLPSDATAQGHLGVVQAALDLLVHRCLVFRIAPSAVDDPPLNGLQIMFRYAVHSYVQRAIFRQLHAPFVEFPLVDQFGLSMWVTQPDDMPKLSRTTARRIATLVAAWAGAPDGRDSILRSTPFHRALAAAEPQPSMGKGKLLPKSDGVAISLPARMLRAALGVVRSTYSVGIVARFHDFEIDAGETAPEVGHFEQHRLLVRWMVERAVDLGHGVSSSVASASSPFYAEEIVWLYNECGLFCLVEGRLDAAAGLFHVALRAASMIEPQREHGALWCRIQMNLSITEIERGRIREARRTLLAIRERDDENPILRILAHGFIGLVEHLSGNLSVAKDIYESVVEDLHPFGQSRAIAIFSRHLAELFRAMGPLYADEATRAIDQAINAAVNGGHEDVHQLALLSRVRLAIDGLVHLSSEVLQRELDKIERYGRVMGMPRLIADTAFARAEHLLKLGETRHAARLACQCLEVATANSLRLRQMTALALLAKIYERRELVRAARLLRARASELAELCDYSNLPDGSSPPQGN